MNRYSIFSVKFYETIYIFKGRRRLLDIINLVYDRLLIDLNFGFFCIF